MAGIDLKKHAGLALTYDSGKLISHEGSVDTGSREVVPIDEVRPQLLNPELSCPVVFYYVFGRIDRKSILKRKLLRFDMYVIPPNLAGIEYVKTKGMRTASYPILIEVVHGYLTLILQIDREDEDGYPITRSSVIKMKRGEKYVIPPDSGFVFVNTRRATTAVSMIRSSKGLLQSVFDDMRGGAHYVIRKNARQEVVQNPSYREVKRVKACKPEDLYKHFGLTVKTPIFKQILRKYDRFKWLHDSTKIDWSEVPTCR